MINKKEIKEMLLDFTIESVENFLAENPTTGFYAFAYDCYAEYAQVSLCFNTENDFQKTLEYYQKGEFSKYYQTEEDIKELKFNTGDWEYQCFDTIYVLEDEKLTEIFNKLYPEDERLESYPLWNEFVESLMCLFCEVMIDFTKTETYQKIPKTADFVTFCIDRNENLEAAFARIEKIKSGV